MKKLLLFALILASPALAVDNNLTCTGASCVVRLQPKDGSGNRVTALSTTAAGAVAMGPSGAVGTGFHSANGSLISSIASTGRGAFVAPDLLEISANLYFDSAGSVRAVGSTTGYSQLNILRQTSGTSDAIQLFTNIADAQTAGSTVVSTSEKKVMAATAAGQWSFGNNGPWFSTGSSGHGYEQRFTTFSSGGSPGANAILNSVSCNQSGGSAVAIKIVSTCVRAGLGVGGTFTNFAFCENSAGSANFVQTTAVTGGNNGMSLPTTAWSSPVSNVANLTWTETDAFMNCVLDVTVSNRAADTFTWGAGF